MPVFFNGRQIISPTTASVVNDDAMRNQNLSVGNNVALIGSCEGGEPQTKLIFGSPQEAEKTLISGELLDAVLCAFTPSAQTNGPSQVIAVRVNPAVRSSGVLQDAQGQDCIHLTSTSYGKEANKIRIKVEAGSIEGLRPTVQSGDAYFTKDNCGRTAFTLAYTGAETDAAVKIDGLSVTLEVPTGTVVADIDLREFTKVQALVDRINMVSGFSAVLGDGNYASLALNGLDYVDSQVLGTDPVPIKADLQAVVDWLNSAQQDFVRAQRSPNAGQPPAIAPFQFLTGGSNGITKHSDWAQAFNVLQYIDAQWITPVSPEGSIHAMADAHVLFMSTVGGKERRAVCGMGASTTDLAAIAAAKSLNSDRTSLLHIGHYNYDTSGKLQLYPAYITAALISGAFAGVNPGTPLTNKSIKVQGLERSLRNPIDTDVLINGGVLCVEETDQGYKVVKSISTWLTNSNFNRVEQSCGVAVDFTVRNVRQSLDVLRGGKGNPLILKRSVSITQSTLRELAREEPQGPGVLAGDKDSPAYKGIKATLEGDVVRVEFECSPVIPANYILVTVYAVPYSGSATAELGAA